MLADVDAGRRAGPIEHEDLLAIVGRVGPSDVDRPGRRLDRETGVGIHGTGMWLDDVDRRRAAVGGPAEDVDHLGRVVVGDPADGPRHLHRFDQGRTVLGRVPADRDDRDPALRGGPRVGFGGDVQLRVVDRREGQAVGRAPDRNRRGQLAGRRIDQLDPLRVGDRDLGQRLDPEASQASVVDGSLDLVALVGAGDPGHGDPVPGPGEALLVGRGVSAEELGDRACRGCGVGDSPG